MRQREYSLAAVSFILATGGFLGGGLIAEPGQVREPIFDFLLAKTAEQACWQDRRLFAKGPQPIALVGVAVDEALRPAGENKQAMIFVLRNLATVLP